MDIKTIINITSQTWCSIMSLIFLSCFILTRRISSRYEKFLAGMIACNLGSMVFEIAALLMLDQPGRMVHYLLIGCCYIEFALMTFLSFLFLCAILEYTQEYLKPTVRKILFRIGVAATGLAEIVLLINICYPVYYTITKQNAYVKLTPYPFLYFQMVFLILMSILVLFLVRRDAERSFIVSTLSYTLAPLIGLILTITVGGMAYGYLGIAISTSILFLYQQFHQYKIYVEKEKDTVIQRIQQNEKIVYDGITRAMQYSDSDRNIQSLIDYIGSSVGAERVYIIEKDSMDRDSNTYEWCAPGVSPQKENLQKLPTEICAPWYDSFRRNKVISISNVEDIKRTEPMIYDTLKPQGITSLYVLPLHDEEKIIGFIGFDNPPKEGLKDAYEILGIVGNFVETLLKKRNLLEDMRKLSYTDAATGAENRLSMYKTFEKISDEQNLGVVFCDINGLKEVNDTKGHSAGDKLILDTYHCIVKGFDKSNVFRVGGDEFVVLMADTTEEYLDRKIAVVRAALMEYRIDVSIGTDLLPQPDGSLEKILATAEERMYEDKAQWYRMTGKKHR